MKSIVLKTFRPLGRGLVAPGLYSPTAFTFLNPMDC